MKIAFLVTEFPSISQTFILNQITGLMDLGHQIEIFALESSKNGKEHPDVLNYDLLDKTTYFLKIPKNWLSRAINGMALLLTNFWRYPAPVIKSLNIPKYGKLAGSLTLFYRILPFLGKGPYDIVHCHFGPMGIIGMTCLQTGALSGKLITAFHGYDLTTYIKKNGSHVYSRLFEYCDLCLPISEHWKKTLQQIGCAENKIKVHRMGVDIHQFTMKQEYRQQNEKLRILSIARLVEKKGIEYSIKAMADVAKHHPHAEYLIIGDGPSRNQLEQLVCRQGLEKQVRFLGWMKQDEIIRIMGQSDILVAPSVTSESGDQEGIPVVLMEALAMGLPVVSTYHSGIPELVHDGESGFLVPEKNVAGLARKLSILIEDEKLRHRLGQRGRQYVEKHYDLTRLNSQLEKIYKASIRGVYAIPKENA